MKQIVLTLGLGLITAITFGQKSNVVSAAMAYNDYEEALGKQDIETAVKEIVVAKELIDKALVHEDTKNDAKCLMYAGKIYISSTVAYAMDSSAFQGLDLEKTANSGFAYFNKSKEVDSKERYKSDIDIFANRYRVMLANQGIAAYDAKQYEMASGGLLGAAKFGELLGVKDSLYLFFGGAAAMQIKEYTAAEEAFKECIAINYNTGESARMLVEALVSQGKKEEAEAALKSAAEKYPKNLQLLINLTNFYIDEKRVEEAEKAISEAIKLDPTNVALVYTSGIIYDGMMRTEEAESAYKKTLELDPKNTDAKYSLGVFYYNLGAESNNKANEHDINDPQYEVLIAEKTEYFRLSVEWLEKASADSPEDVVILEALKSAYGKAGDVEKFKLTKARIVELKG